MCDFVLSKLADDELKTNIAETEVFVLPSGQEIEKEDILSLRVISLQIESDKLRVVEL